MMQVNRRVKNMLAIFSWMGLFLLVWGIISFMREYYLMGIVSLAFGILSITANTVCKENLDIA